MLENILGFFAGLPVLALLLVAVALVVAVLTFTTQSGRRMSNWLFSAVLLLFVVGLFSPVNLPVIVYKVCMVIIGAIMGYLIDHLLFPKARPHAFLHPGLIARFTDGSTLLGDGWKGAEPLIFAFGFATLRRALIVIACVLGLTLGL